MAPAKAKKSVAAKRGGKPEEPKTEAAPAKVSAAGATPATAIPHLVEDVVRREGASGPDGPIGPDRSEDQDAPTAVHIGQKGAGYGCDSPGYASS